MAQPNGRTEEDALDLARATASSRLQETVRSIAHDLNGALNTLSLNVELIDAATVHADAGADPAAGRARALANLRRAVREIQGIVELRLLQVGRTGEPDRTSAS